MATHELLTFHSSLLRTNRSLLLIAHSLLHNTSLLILHFFHLTDLNSSLQSDLRFQCLYLRTSHLLVTPHFSQLTLHSLPIPFNSLLTLYRALLTFHCSFLTATRSLQFIRHCFPLTPHYIAYFSLLTFDCSLLIPKCSHLTPHSSLLSHEESLLTPRSTMPHTFHHSIISSYSYYSLLSTHSSFTNNSSLFTDRA